MRRSIVLSVLILGLMISLAWALTALAVPGQVTTRLDVPERLQVTATPLPTVTPDFGTPGADVLPTATEILPPGPTSAAPGCDTILPLDIGTSVTVRSGISIRDSPSPSAPLMETILQDRSFTVIDGPVCNTNYVWWRVTRTGLTGWVAERNTAITFIIDFDGADLTCVEPRDLSIGQRVTLINNVRIRQDATIEGRVLTVAPSESVVTILSPASCVDGYNWRRVRVRVLDIRYEGWMAESERDSTDLAFFEQDNGEICYPPIAFEVGDLARVYYRSGPRRNLRNAPGLDSGVLWTLVDGVPVEILGGPVCLDTNNWWFVRVLGDEFQPTGWLAEGGRPIPHIRPFDEPPLLLPGR